MVNPIRTIVRRVIETARALRQNKALVCRQTAAGRKGQSLIELHTVAHTYSGEVPSASEEGGFLTGLGLQGGHWLLLFLIPILAAVATSPPTRLAARNTLRSLT